MTVGIFMLCFFRTWLSEAYTLSIYLLQSLQRHLSAFQSCIFPVRISNDFAFLISQGINFHIMGTREDMLSVSKYTVQFFCL